jgi:hypothetical protein
LIRDVHLEVDGSLAGGAGNARGKLHRGDGTDSEPTHQRVDLVLEAKQGFREDVHSFGHHFSFVN